MRLLVRQLSKQYPGGIQSLRDVTLEIAPGMFGLLGPNGAGKSTLMRTLATLQDADSGSVLLNDVDVLKEKAKVRMQLGYLPQEFGLDPSLTAWRMLNLFAAYKGITQSRIRREVCTSLLQRTNLYDVRARRLGSFSGGMKQRLGIAIALLGSPSLIIVDEPTAGLDPEERNRFHNLLGEIAEDVIVILSTHIVSDVSDLCQRMAVMNRGQVILTGTPATAIRAMEGKVWQKRVRKREVPIVEQEHEVISKKLFAGETIIHVFCEDHPGGSFELAEPDLQDAYFWAIKRHNEADSAAVSV